MGNFGGDFVSNRTIVTREFVARSFAQRREKMVRALFQFKLDVDSYNENGNPVEPIQVVFDFTEDMAELEALRVSKLQ